MKISFFLPLLLALKVPEADMLRLGMINGGSDFFIPIADGFVKKADLLGHETIVVRAPDKTGPDDDFCGCQCVLAPLIEEMFEAGVDGLALRPCENGKKNGPNMTLEESMEAYYAAQRKFAEQGKPIIFFDQDYPDNPYRTAYVGTDDTFLGETMARTLRQLVPQGGTYGILGAKFARSSGFVKEIERYNDNPNRPHWSNVLGNETVECCDHQDISEAIDLYAELGTTAILFFRQTPMRHPNYTEIVDRHRGKNITFIGVDGADYQLEYLNTGYVDGLVGQMPWSIGTSLVEKLEQFAAQKAPEQDFFPSNLIAYSIIPAYLPEATVNNNLLGNLRITGLTLFGIIALMALICMIWTFYHRNDLVVNIAQPSFLIMVAGGILILASSLVPLSYDDGGDPSSMSPSYAVGICMSIPWLGFTGFTVTFTALFAKTWRVNKIFRQSSAYMKQKVSAREVLAPLLILLGLNFVVLICWTIIDPLTYTREELEGTDYWNRVIASYGFCSSDRTAAFISPLIVINFIALAITCWQALQARNIESDFSEAKFIGLSLASILQTFLSGIPIIAVVRNMPDAFYLITTFMVFFLCTVVLCFIFIPKMIKQRQFANLSKKEQMFAIRASIRKTVKNQNGSSDFFSGEGSNFASREQRGLPASSDSRPAQKIEAPFFSSAIHSRLSGLAISSLTNPPEMTESMCPKGDRDSTASVEKTSETLTPETNAVVKSMIMSDCIPEEASGPSNERDDEKKDSSSA